MIRAKSARGNNSDDIPLAKRVGKNFWRDFEIDRRLLFRFFIFVFFGGVVLFFSLLFRKVDSDKNLELSKIKDSKLLGHLPYSETSSSQLKSLPNGMKVHVEVFDAINEMQSKAALDGVQLIVISGFRSIKTQREIFYSLKSSRNQIAVERAKVSAPPGYSEHSTGYAVDFGDRNMPSTDFEVSFESTPSFNWLKNNAAKFHFTLSFPKGNPQGVSYEPWHWRYEGTVEALKRFEPANKIRRK